MCLAYGLEKVTIHNTAFMLLQNLHLLKRTFHFISKRSFQSHFKRSFQNFIFQIYFWQNIEVGGGGSGNTKRLDLIKMLISKFLCIHHVNQTAFIVKKSNSFILNMPLLLPPTKKREGEKKKKKKGNTLATSPRNHMLCGKTPLSHANPSRQSFVSAFAVKVCHSSLSRGEKCADSKWVSLALGSI